MRHHAFNYGCFARRLVDPIVHHLWPVAAGALAAAVLAIALNSGIAAVRA
jgi:hypothetical protein